MNEKATLTEVKNYFGNYTMKQFRDDWNALDEASRTEIRELVFVELHG